jgi:hypothetical protein
MEDSSEGKCLSAVLLAPVITCGCILQSIVSFGGHGGTGSTVKWLYLFKQFCEKLIKFVHTLFEL